MRPRKTRAKRSGFVLVLVLCMVIMLAVLLFAFNHRSRAELLEVESLRKSEQALNCATAGLNMAIAAVRDANGIHTNTKLSSLLSGDETVELVPGACSVTVTEESAKINVNTLKDNNGGLNRGAIERLLRLTDLLNRRRFEGPRISYSVVCSIIDWTDSDDRVTSLPFVKGENLGAESDYYTGLPAPYACKNDLLDTTEELLLLKGVTADVFESMRDYITVKGDGKININSASQPVIESLSEKMDRAVARMIVDRRRARPFRHVTELRDVPGMTDNIYAAISGIVTVGSGSRYYQVISKGTFDGACCTIIAMLERNTEAKSVDVIMYKEI
ncbi:MAG: type II secretion system minor pseudopilin GspK [Phycisphaerales bacterium]|nr:MAG: type II secretion system minor pseudopilin GspK [Phycisphaerales bacterium]